jgi:hypothetical protein
VGFAFSIEDIRELLSGSAGSKDAGLLVERPLLVAYGQPDGLAAALERLDALHAQGRAAELLPEPIGSHREAEAVAFSRDNQGLEWLG